MSWSLVLTEIKLHTPSAKIMYTFCINPECEFDKGANNIVLHFRRKYERLIGDLLDCIDNRNMYVNL